MDEIDLAVYKKKLSTQGSVEIRIVSDSMLPCLRVGEIIQVVPLKKEFKTFDLVVFFYQKKFICHYVWRNQISFNGTIVTRSLKESRLDEAPHPISNLLGSVQGKSIPVLTRFRILIVNLLSGSL